MCRVGTNWAGGVQMEWFDLKKCHAFIINIKIDIAVIISGQVQWKSNISWHKGKDRTRVKI